MFDQAVGGETMAEEVLSTAEDREIALIGKALSNPIRVRMLRFIGAQGAYCGDLTERFGLAQSTVSHHIRILKEAGLIEGEEQGTSTCYRVVPRRCEAVCRLISETLRGAAGLAR